VEERLDRAAGGEGAEQAKQRADGDGSRRLGHNGARDRCGWRADGFADPELAGPAADGVGEHTVEADGGEEERETGKDAEQRRVEARSGECAPELRVDRRDLADRGVRRDVS